MDYSLGTDDSNHGNGQGSNAFKTIQYAWSNLSCPVTMNTNIYLSADTYSENIDLSDRQFTGNYRINIIGTLNPITSFAIIGGTQGATNSLPTVTSSNLGDYQNKIISFNGLNKIIESNTATTIILASQTVTQPSGTGTVYDCG